MRETLPDKPVPLRIVQVHIPLCVRHACWYVTHVDGLQTIYDRDFRMLMKSGMLAQAINTHLYSVHGFRGNEQDYYNPDNSCLNKASMR